MLENWIRKSYQAIFVDPLVRCINDKASPMLVTLLAVIFGVLFVPAIVLGDTIIAIILLLLSGYCDTLDGSLARHQSTSSPLGSVCDIMADRLVEFSVIFGLFLINPATRALATVLMLGSVLLCVTSFLVVGVFSENDSEKSFHYSPGIMERAEAFIFFILMVLLPQYFNLLAFIFAFLVALTAIIRLVQFTRCVYPKRAGDK